MTDEPNSTPHPLNPSAAATFGHVQQSSEGFGSVPKAAEPFRNAPHSSARPENHTLSVREAARLFEAAHVARSERSVVNWCQPNRQGIARLDAYFDPNERRYFITPQSVEAVIAEEKARTAKANAEPVPQPAEGFGNGAKQDAEAFRKVPKHSAISDSEPSHDTDELSELKKENLDLKITNRGKDYFIEQLKTEREGLLKQVVDSNQRIGQLETRLLQLDDRPRENGSDQNELTA